VWGGGERGFTLVELLVAMVIALIVGAAGVAFMVVAFHQQNAISSRTTATNQAEQGLEQLVRDLREATTGVTISNPTGSTTQAQFNIPTPLSAGTSTEQVTWTCATSGVGTCTRVLGTGSTATTKTEIAGVQSMVFTPTYGGTATTPTNATDIASVAMTLTVRVTTYGLTSNGTVTTAVPGTASSPIVLQATADLRNFA
jgi:prepilin-type N-terminal cleavage/methylation domain-containing protein